MMNARVVTLALLTLLASLHLAYAQVNLLKDSQCQKVADDNGLSATGTAEQCSSSVCSSIEASPECSASNVVGICCFNTGASCAQVCVTRAAHPH
jgi:hypothetical protein